MKNKFAFNILFLTLITSTALAGSPLTPDQSISLPGKAGRFDYMQVDPGLHRLLAAHKKTGSLTIYDLKTEKLLPSIDTGAAQGLAVDTKNGKYFVGDEDEKKIVVINAKTLTKMSDIPLDGPVDAITYDPKNEMLYADEDNGKKIWVINTKTEKILTTIPLLGEPEFLEYGPTTDRIYQNIKSNDTLVVINPNTNKVESTWSTLPATSPHGLALDEKQGHIFSAGKNGKLVELDIKTGKNIANVDIAPFVDQITFDSEKHIIYCASRGAISATRETASGLELLGSVSSPEGSHTLAVDPVKHDVWVSYADKDKSYLKKFKSTP